MLGMGWDCTEGCMRELVACWALEIWSFLLVELVWFVFGCVAGERDNEGLY